MGCPWGRGMACEEGGSKERMVWGTLSSSMVKSSLVRLSTS